MTNKPTITKPKSGKDRLKELKKEFDKVLDGWLTEDRYIDEDKAWKWITTNFKPNQ